MASTYWIKLYHEILNDPKMGRLPDRLWRRVVECFLLAGEAEDDGFLPPVEDMAWKLHVQAGELEAELQEISRLTDIIELVPVTNVSVDSSKSSEMERCWFVVKFTDRQVSSGAERVRRFREKRKVVTDVTLPVTAGVTDRLREEKEKREREETELDDVTPPHVTEPEDVLAYHFTLSNTGLNAAQSSLLLAGAEALGVEKVCKAIKSWLERGYKPWNVEGILDVARNGWDDGKPLEPKLAPAKGGKLWGAVPSEAELSPPAPVPEHARVWSELLDSLKLQMTAPIYQKYFAKTQAVSLADGCLTVKLGTGYEWVTGRMSKVVKSAAGARGVNVLLVK